MLTLMLMHYSYSYAIHLQKAYWLTVTAKLASHCRQMPRQSARCLARLRQQQTLAISAQVGWKGMLPASRTKKVRNSIRCVYVCFLVGGWWCILFFFFLFFLGGMVVQKVDALCGEVIRPLPLVWADGSGCTGVLSLESSHWSPDS